MQPQTVRDVLGAERRACLPQQAQHPAPAAARRRAGVGGKQLQRVHEQILRRTR